MKRPEAIKLEKFVASSHQAHPPTTVAAVTKFDNNYVMKLYQYNYIHVHLLEKKMMLKTNSAQDSLGVRETEIGSKEDLKRSV